MLISWFLLGKTEADPTTWQTRAKSEARVVADLDGSTAETLGIGTGRGSAGRYLPHPAISTGRYRTLY